MDYLSYSSAALLKNCSQKYYWYKVKQVARDADSDQDTTALDVGSAFHYVLEHSGHTDKDIGKHLTVACKEYNCEDQKALINAMVLKYLKAHKKSGLSVVQCEFEISDEVFLGYVDVVLSDEQGFWWIADLKTASRFSDITAAALHNNVQLNLYAHYSAEIAKHLKLDPDKFQGTRYRVTTKSKLKRKVTESHVDLVRRIYHAIESYDVAVPVALMNPQETFDNHMRLYHQALKLKSGEIKPSKNLSYCDSFFKPCEYFSQCHGYTFSELKDRLEVIRG